MPDTIIPLECLDHPDSARAWASIRFDQALLVLADLTPQLRPLARHWVLYDAHAQLFRGIAVRFEGFDQPVASIVAEDEDAFNKLLAQVRGAVSTFVFASGLEHVPVKLRSSVVSTDMWMVAPCLLHRERPDPDIERLEDVSELQSFLLRMGMNFWNPAMLRFGHTFGIRSKDLLVCAAGVNFILSDESYAQIGPVVTDPAQRGKSMATRLLDTIRSSLAEAGIGQCGVFVSETDKDVVAFYGRRGFMRRGQFWLLKVTEDQPSF